VQVQGSLSGQAICSLIQDVAGAQGAMDRSTTCTPTLQTAKSETQAVQREPQPTAKSGVAPTMKSAARKKGPSRERKRARQMAATQSASSATSESPAGESAVQAVAGQLETASCVRDCFLFVGRPVSGGVW